MFKSLSGEGHLTGGQSSPSPPRHGITSPVLDGQESSWIGLLSVLPRPALSFLERYLPGRARNPTLCGERAGGVGGGAKSSFVDEEGEFLRQLDDMMPLTEHAAPHLTYLQCQHGGSSPLSWLTSDSLQELGIESAEETNLTICSQTQVGYLSSARTFLSHIRLSPSQEVRPTGGGDWLTKGGTSSRKSRTWWGSFWGGEETLQKGLLSDLSWAEGRTLMGTKAPTAETAGLFVQSESMPGENTGVSEHKEVLANNGGLHTVQNIEGSVADPRISISQHLSSSGASACSEGAPLTPDQDNGYSSLEEEHFQMRAEQPPPEPPEPQAGTEIEGGSPKEWGGTAGQLEEDAAGRDSRSAEGLASPPQCQNKAIAFIMGCPCSDDESSQSDWESSHDDDDDDGFDSKGSSDLSDSSDEDDEASDSDSEQDPEAERLWSSLCQSVDPYNPQNFTARLHTSSTPPRTVPTSTLLSSTQSTPASSPHLTALPLSSPASDPPSGVDVWDDSTSASEADEAESLRLWSSFSCSSDPYSPFNFQAPLRTRVPVEGGAGAKRALQTPPRSPRHTSGSPPEYRKEEAEERLDSGFSEASASSCCAKKVRFSDDVEEFFASCGEEEEDRRGPWEELARDRCRFLRRCQEVEQSIAFCLHPQHRRRVYQRLATLERPSSASSVLEDDRSVLC